MIKSKLTILVILMMSLVTYADKEKQVLKYILDYSAPEDTPKSTIKSYIKANSKTSIKQKIEPSQKFYSYKHKPTKNHITEIEIDFLSDKYPSNSKIELADESIKFLEENSEKIYTIILDYYLHHLPKEWDFGPKRNDVKYFTTKVNSIESMLSVIGTKWIIFLDNDQEVHFSIPCAIDGEHDLQISFKPKTIIAQIWVE